VGVSWACGGRRVRMCIPPFCRICKIIDESVKSYSGIFLLMRMIASYNVHVCRDMICYYGIGSNYCYNYYHYHFYSSNFFNFFFGRSE